MPDNLPDAPGGAPQALLRMRGIVVAYGSLLANDHVDLDVRAGDIHALLGENGAGKTTLMKALVGLAPLAGGTIELGGRTLPAMTPLAARDAGIGMVHQHFMLIPTLTVAQNVCIGLRSEGYPFPDYRRVTARLEALSAQYQMKVDPGARVSDLSVGEQQRVEILRALYRGARLLVLDEPTSVLIPQEVDGLFEIIRGLSADGTAVIFISHKLNEVMSICRDVTILRAGTVAARRHVADTDAGELARLMVGREMEALPPATALTADAPVVARLRGIRCTDSRGVRKLNGIDLDVRAGEIHGIAGVDGNGQGELAAIIAGLAAPSAGTLHLGGADITRMHPSQRIRSGLAWIPGDRQRTALAMPLSISDNLLLKAHDRRPYCTRGFLDRGRIREMVDRSIRDYRVACAGPDQPVRALSGGNQQKVVLARELLAEPSLVVAVQPTHGLDVGATAYVHGLLREQQRRGCAILLVSTELDEILLLSNRVSVLYEGRLAGPFERSAVDRQSIGLLMAGKRP